MSVIQTVKRVLYSDGFDPFDLTQMEPPETFRSGRFSVDLEAPYNPYEGFHDSMVLLGKDLQRGIEVYGKKKSK